jgi:hypothetical protein
MAPQSAELARYRLTRARESLAEVSAWVEEAEKFVEQAARSAGSLLRET